MKVFSLVQGDWIIAENDILVVHDKIPTNIYTVQMSNSNLFLRENTDTLTNEKMYGTNYVDIIMPAYEASYKSMGVLFSGAPGLGKSMLARRICQAALDKDIPVIIIDKPYANLVSFIQSIKQEVVLLFDEFEKTFTAYYNDEDDNDKTAQTSLLSLLDGVDQQKRLYLFTCNNILNISSYLLNRPGRIHYHIAFKNPNVDVIREYFQDNIKKEFHDKIDNAVNTCVKLVANFDILRAIAFEINLGRELSDIIKILNISNNEIEYAVICKYGNYVFSGNDCFNIFAPDNKTPVYNEYTNFCININPKNIEFDYTINAWKIKNIYEAISAKELKDKNLDIAKIQNVIIRNKEYDNYAQITSAISQL